MVTIRLSRTGAKKRPFYHVVVTDSRNARDGRFTERLGYFDPMPGGASEQDVLYVNTKRFEYWLSQGAKMSERVSKLYKNHRKKAVAA